MQRMKTVITYGTFDLMHYGHVELLRRAYEQSQGGRLIVGVSTDEFNALKGKKSHFSFAKRAEMVGALRYVDIVIPERTWEQKRVDIQHYHVDTFVMGDDWTGKFDDLRDLCEVVYLNRTPSVSSTALRQLVRQIEESILG